MKTLDPTKAEPSAPHKSEWPSGDGQNAEQNADTAIVAPNHTKRLATLRATAALGGVTQAPTPNLTAIQPSVADEINAEHAAAFGKAREALEHARRAGELLTLAKAAVEHGAWLPWIDANCKFSARTAQGYIRLAQGWDALQAKCATVAHLGLREALDLLAESPAAAEEVPPLRGGIQDAEDPGEYLRREAITEIYRLAPGVILTPTSMQLPDNLPYENWKKIGSILRALPGETPPERRRAAA